MSSANKNRALGAVLGLVVWLTVAGSARADNRSWINPAGGAATNTANWSPAGVPVPSDYDFFEETGTFTTSWASPADSIGSMTVSYGCNPTFTIANHLGIADHILIDGVSTLTIASGVLGVGYINAASTDLGALAVDGVTSEVDAGEAVMGSTGGVSRLDVLNAGRFFCRGQIELGLYSGSQFAGSIHHALHFGFPYLFYHYPVIYTLPSGGSNPECAIGVSGSATLDAYDGGYLNTIGPLFIGKEPGGSGVLHCYPGGGLASGVTSNGETWIGGNSEFGTVGGSGSVVLEGSFSYFTGLCHLGDTDDTPNGPVTKLLQLDNGAYTVFAGGLTMTPALTSRFDVTGGTTHVIGGPVTIQQASPFELGSANGHSPTLWLENGTTTDIWPNTAGAPALGIGRGGPGTLNVAGAGTSLTVHGTTAIADSIYGSATVTIDSAATAHFTGALRIGGGSGQCQVHANGSGTSLAMQDSLVLGSGAYGFGGVYLDTLASLTVSGPTLIGSQGSGVLWTLGGSHSTLAGLSVGPAQSNNETVLSELDVTDHFDLTGNGLAIADTGGVVHYNGSRSLSVGDGAAHLVVDSGGFLQASPEIDVRGKMTLSVGILDLLAAQASPGTTAARVVFRRPRSARAQSAFTGAPGLVQCPLTRVMGSGSLNGLGTIQGRVHLDSGTATFTVAPDFGPPVTGRTVVGDTTKTDGFVSIGQTSIASGDTLALLDADGADLGKVAISGGFLQLPKPGHLKRGFLLNGTGTVLGSLDVRDSAWVSFTGQVSGDVALAGTLDTGPSVDALIVGSMHDAATGVTAFKIGHTQQDLIVAQGPVVLAGTIDVRSLLGDAPSVGDTFTVMVGGAISGSFANVTVNGHPAAGAVVALVRAGDVRVAITGAVTGVGDTPPPPASSELRFAALGGLRDAALALDLPSAATVRVTLYDVSGRQVAALADGELGPGRHRFELARAGLGSGMYFARAVVAGAAGARALTTHVVLLR